MPEAPTTNDRSNQYFNRNECRSFNIQVSTSMVRLSGRDSGAPGTATGQGQECSEVFIVNKSGGAVELFDRADAWGNAEATAASRAFLLDDNDSVTLRGLTNVNQVSAKGSGNGTIYYRTQFFSSNPIR
tara:strand:+ start:1599 stop:1985 length:387 start_codon:yes stop_codon:yes gene_type:complete